MIKNLLYSLFLHFLLLLLLYANFNLKNINENKSSEIAVSLISISGSEDFVKSKISEQKEQQAPKKTRKTTAKEAKSQKQSNKNQVTDAPQKPAESKPAQELTTPTSDKNPELKSITAPDKKQEESNKDKQDQNVNKNSDEKKIDATKKDQNLGAEKQSTEEQELNKEKNPEKASKASSANNLENIDLSVREKFNIQAQLKRCYSRAVTESNSNAKSKLTIKVKINEDGVINSDIEDLVDIERYNDPKDINYKMIVDNSRRAIELCSPLRNLPIEKYEIWKEVVLEFGDN